MFGAKNIQPNHYLSTWLWKSSRSWIMFFVNMNNWVKVWLSSMKRTIFSLHKEKQANECYRDKWQKCMFWTCFHIVLHVSCGRSHAYNCESAHYVFFVCRNELGWKLMKIGWFDAKRSREVRIWEHVTGHVSHKICQNGGDDTFLKQLS